MNPSLINLLTALHGSLLAVIEIQSPAFFPRDDLAVVPGDGVVDCLGALVTLLTLLPLHVAVLLDVDFPTLFVWDVFTHLSGHFGALLVVNCFTFLLGDLGTQTLQVLENTTSYSSYSKAACRIIQTALLNISDRKGNIFLQCLALIFVGPCQ